MQLKAVGGAEAWDYERRRILHECRILADLCGNVSETTELGSGRRVFSSALFDHVSPSSNGEVLYLLWKALYTESHLHTSCQFRPVRGRILAGYMTPPRVRTLEIAKQQEIPDYTRVESIYGNKIDLSKQPVQKGNEEIVISMSDNSKDFCYTAVTNPEKQ